MYAQTHARPYKCFLGVHMYESTHLIVCNICIKNVINHKYLYIYIIKCTIQYTISNNKK